MESLALAAAIVVLSIVVFGGLSVLVAWRNPSHPWSRVLGVVVSIPTVVAGGWLAWIDVGVGARVIGAVVAGLGLAAFFRAARKG
ncbi:MAG: hypothetical protein ACKOHN_02840 [Actinomycetota bacterium]